MDRPTVFDHADFRRFLADWFASKKAANPRFSHRAFARRLGSKDPSLLLNVIHGRRPLTPERVEKFVEVLDLHGDAAEYFRLLVRFGQARQTDARERAWAEVELLRSRLRVPEIDRTRFLFASNRLYAALHSLAECRGFEAEPGYVARALEVTEEEAQDALDVLFALGFLVREGDVVRPAHPAVRTAVRVPDLGSYDYHRQNHALAGQVLDRLWDPESGLADRTAFLGFTLAVPQSRLGDLRTLLWEAHNRVMNESDRWDDKDQLVQISVQMFPISRPTS